MTPLLSDSIGGGTDLLLLPGWTLSGGTIGHQVDLRDYLVSVARRDAADVEAVEQDVANGIFEYGSDTYSAAVLDDAMMPVLLAINLRSHHPSVSDEAAASLINDDNRDALRRHLRRAWGYRVRVAAKSDDREEGEPSNWRAIIAFLRRTRHLTYEQIRALSPGQLNNELMARPEEATAEERAIAAAKRAAANEKAKALVESKSFARLDAIATDHGITPLELCKLDDDKVFKWVFERRNINRPPPKLEATAAVLVEYRKHYRFA